MHRHTPAQTFLEAPFAERLEEPGPSFAYLGIPYTSPYGDPDHRPCEPAPDAVRRATLEFEYDLLFDHYDFDCDAALMPPGVSVVDAGDVPCAPDRIDDARLEAAEAVAAIRAASAIPLVVGGDDALPAMVGSAFADGAGLNVLHIDAHLDFRDEVDGYKYGYSSPIRRLREMPHVREIVQLGLRGIGSARPDEVADARAAGNRLITATELHAIGAQRVLEELPDDHPWFVTIDCDGLDPSVAPGVEWPEPDGVTYGEAATLVRGLARSGRIAAIAFTEYAPVHDVRNLTALAIGRLLMNVITLTPAGASPPPKPVATAGPIGG